MSRAEANAESDAPNVQDAKRRLAAKLNDHIGRDHAISAAALADYLDGQIKETTIRDAMAELRVEYDIPVVSCSQGYYVLDSHAGLERELERMDDRIQTIKERRRELTRAFNQREYGGGE